MPVFVKDGTTVLYVHVPKTGGTSLEQVFLDSGYEMHYHDDVFGPGTMNRVRRCTPQHMHAALLRETFALRRFDVVFMTVREPVARFRSEFGMRNRDLPYVDEATVEAWAHDVLDRYTRNPYVLDNHVRPQSAFLLPRAEVHHLEVGLPAIVDRLDAAHGLGLTATDHRLLDRAAASGFSSADVPVSRGLERRLQEFYRDDFARFGYGEQGRRAAGPRRGRVSAGGVAD
jgi:hypothetical protein